MNKILKNEKIYRNFIKKFKFFLKNKLIIGTPHYFDLDHKLIKYCLIVIYFVVQNPINKIKNNLDKLNVLFCDLYQNLANSKYYEKIKNNFDLTNYDEVKFKNFAINLCFIFEQEIKNKEIFIALITSGLNYFFLNNIDCKITLDLKKNPANKIDFAIFITKQFAKLKEIILKNFKNNANELIILIIGMSKQMN